MTSPAELTTTIDQATFTITFQRQFAAPRDQVFDAWTRAEQVAQWWDPTGVPLRECTIDLRVGGAFRFANASGHGPPFAGQYLAIDRPRELMFEALGAVGTVRLDGDEQTTHMIVTIRCASAEHLTQFVHVGVATNTDLTLDNLVEHVQRSKIS